MALPHATNKTRRGVFVPADKYTAWHGMTIRCTVSCNQPGPNHGCPHTACPHLAPMCTRVPQPCDQISRVRVSCSKRHGAVLQSHGQHTDNTTNVGTTLQTSNHRVAVADSSLNTAQCLNLKTRRTTLTIATPRYATILLPPESRANAQRIW